jgi:hypothetical protein
MRLGMARAAEGTLQTLQWLVPAAPASVAVVCMQVKEFEELMASGSDRDRLTAVVKQGQRTSNLEMLLQQARSE